MSTIKFRPQLSLNEIDTIIQYLPPTHPLTSKFQQFKLKVDVGLVKPSALTTAKQTLDQSLGFTPPSTQTIESLMELWESNPKALSKTQLAQVNHHRYINDMMSPDEEYAYEQVPCGMKPI